MTLQTPRYKQYMELRLPFVNVDFEYEDLRENEAEMEKVSEIVCGPVADFVGMNSSKYSVRWTVPLIPLAPHKIAADYRFCVLHIITINTTEVSLQLHETVPFKLNLIILWF